MTTSFLLVQPSGALGRLLCFCPAFCSGVSLPSDAHGGQSQVISAPSSIPQKESSKVLLHSSRRVLHRLEPQLRTGAQLNKVCFWGLALLPVVLSLIPLLFPAIASPQIPCTRVLVSGLLSRGEFEQKQSICPF